MTPADAILIAVLLPLVGAVLIALTGAMPNLRETVTLVTAALLLADVLTLVPAVFPDSLQTCMVASTVSRAVSIAGITSTSFMRDTGEKKCVPIKRLRRCALTCDDNPVIEILEVLLAMMQLSGTISSSLANTAALTASSSNTASMTKSRSE